MLISYLSLYRPFLDDSLMQVKRMMEGGQRERMMFSKHTLPVFIPLPPTCVASRNTKEKIIICVDLSTPDRNP